MEVGEEGEGESWRRCFGAIAAVAWCHRKQQINGGGGET